MKYGKKKKKSKYYKILKYFNDNFEFIKNDEERNSIDSIYSHLELINESNIIEEKKDKKEKNENNENDSLYLIKQKLKKNLKYRKNTTGEKKEEKDDENINNFNIGIPKELLSKDIILNHNHKYKYDGGDLPTFFARDKNNYKFYEEEEKEDSSNEEEKSKKKNNLNKRYIYHFNHVLNIRRNLFLVGYENVAVIYPGMSFGEISLLTEKHKRTSTIFIDEDSQIGRLNLGEYNITIKSVRAKMRTDSINFLLGTKLFGDISYLYFLNKYWIYFQCKKIQKGDFLFKMGEQSESIYIIYDGEIKLNSYIDKDSIDDLINAIEYNEIKKKNYYIIKINKNKNSNNNNNSSIFERKQKYCLMIGKKGDILGLDDIINYKNNKYICEAQVTTEYLSYYEINKSIIFNQISNLKSSRNPLNYFFNIDNIYNIIKTKQDFMIHKLKNIKMTIEQRFKFFYDDNNSCDNNKKKNKKNKLNKKEDNKNKLNKKSLSLYSIIDKKEKMNENNNSKNKNTFSSSFFNNENIKENINLISSHDKLKKKNISQNIKKIITTNKINTKNSLTSYFANLPKSTGNTPNFKNLINLKLKNKTNIDLNNIMSKNEIKTNTNIKFGVDNIFNFNYKNKSNKSVGDNSKIYFDEIECAKKTKFNYKACKPYEFPKIDDENIFIKNNLNSLKKNKILKFLFLNDNNSKYKIFKKYSIKKNNLLNNYFISTMKSNSSKNNFFFENNSIDKNINRDKNLKSTNSENKKLNNQTEKSSYRIFRFNDSNNNLKNDKGIDMVINNYPNSKNLLNKNIQVNISPEKKDFSPNFFKKYKKKYLMKNFYFLLNNENKKKRLKINTNLLPSIEKSKNK